MASNGLALFNNMFIGLNDVEVESRAKTLICPSIASNYFETIPVDIFSTMYMNSVPLWKHLLNTKMIQLRTI